ncbi:MAG TPA: hypothetical protein VG457_14160, partial [Planctomycetota bacterium]|nr:hypothetical protein [Planctomycetota bacterium]
ICRRFEAGRIRRRRLRIVLFDHAVHDSGLKGGCSRSKLDGGRRDLPRTSLRPGRCTLVKAPRRTAPLKSWIGG